VKETFSEKPTEGLIIGTHVDPSSTITRYRALDLATGQPVFERGPFSGHTNNCDGFIAIVHALAHSRAKKAVVPIYLTNRRLHNESRLGRVTSGATSTKNRVEYTNRIRLAQKWLHSHKYENQVRSRNVMEK